MRLVLRIVVSVLIVSFLTSCQFKAQPAAGRIARGPLFAAEDVAFVSLCYADKTSEAVSLTNAVDGSVVKGQHLVEFYRVTDPAEISLMTQTSQTLARQKYGCGTFISILGYQIFVSKTGVPLVALRVEEACVVSGMSGGVCEKDGEFYLTGVPASWYASCKICEYSDLIFNLTKKHSPEHYKHLDEGLRRMGTSLEEAYWSRELWMETAKKYR